MDIQKRSTGLGAALILFMVLLRLSCTGLAAPVSADRHGEQRLQLPSVGVSAIRTTVPPTTQPMETAAPTTVPTTAPMVTVARAIRKVLPAPCRTRLKMSRPKLSVPSRWAMEGASNLPPTLMAEGS